jgi:DNA-binding transcriptional LysR family regulator
MEISEVRPEVAETRVELSGRLRRGAPVLFAPAHVAPVVREFMVRYETELKVSNIAVWIRSFETRA